MITLKTLKISGLKKPKKDKPIMLCLVIDKSKVIGAYLDYAGYKPGIEPINFKDNFK